MKRMTFISTAIVLAVTLLSSFGGQVAAAGSASFSLSPNTSTVNLDSVFGVTVYENGTDVNVVTADLTYDASKLEFVNIDATGSAFANSVNASGGGGTVGLSRYTAPGTTVSGNQKVATIHFKAKAGSGTTTVAMANSSKIASNGADIWNHAAVSGTYTLTTPTPAPTPNPTPAPTQQNSSPRTSNTPSSTTSTNATTASTNAVLDIDTQQSAMINQQPEEVAQAGQPEVATTAKTTSNTFRYVVLGLLVGLVTAIVVVRRLVQAKEARQAKSRPKTKKNKSKK